MASPFIVGAHQQQTPSHQLKSKKHSGGFLARLFGSLHGGRRAGSTSASTRTCSPWIPSAAGAAVVQASSSQRGSVACSAVAVAPAASAGVCTSAPFLGYATDIETKYTFSRELGKGGNGVVRVVIARETGEEFACKSIRKVLSDASEQKKQGHLESVRREVQVLTKLRGSLNIVKLEDVFEDDECVHIVMEWCKGGELWHRIGDRHYSERTVASFMRAVLRTLAQCHAQNILHRDIKPGNFMLLTEDDRAPLKAIDFGLAAFFEPDHLPRTDLGLEGTPWYMAPETLRGEWYPASDIWAAGVMAFQLLCGRFPFDDKKNTFAPAITAIWRSVLNDSLDFSKPYWTGISEEAKDFCRLMLNRDVAARPTAKEALKHPWLQGNSSERSVGKKLDQSVVARIQRFASGSQLKRTVLQSIAAELLGHPDLLTSERDQCTTSDTGRPIVTTPDSACLDSVLEALRLDSRGAMLNEEQLGDALKSMGFRLGPGEVSRLMEQVDLEGTGAIDRAEFAASQMDWRHLQKNHTELWLELAANAFRSMDTDGSGVLEVDELLETLRARLPPDEVQTALELALLEAGAASAGSDVEEVQGIDFDGFVALLKMNSLDSLDMYDDRMSSRSLHGSLHGSLNGSLHGSLHGSMDRHNGLLAASPRTGDWSRHKVGGSRHGPLSEASGHSRTGSEASGDVASAQGNSQQQAPAGVAFRFDIDRNDRSASGKAGSAGAGKEGTVHGVAGGGRAAGASTSGGMVWRFDVAGPAAPPPPPAPKPVWRFDVAGAGKAGWQQPPEERGAGSGGAGATGASAPAAAAQGSIISSLGRQGGYYDRRMHGSDLYRNVALKALQAAGQRLDTVAE